MNNGRKVIKNVISIGDKSVIYCKDDGKYTLRYKIRQEIVYSNKEFNIF